MKKHIILSLMLACAWTFASAGNVFDRGLGNQKSVFIPKGTVAVSLSVGYNNWNADGEGSTIYFDEFALLYKK